jgi:FkbM family methyltransferase
MGWSKYPRKEIKLHMSITKIFEFLKRRYAPRGAYQSFVHTGEDLVVEQALLSFGQKKISYIDIGCHHPIFGNITYLFYKKGGSGVVVEPNKNLCSEIKKKRNRDICIEGGIGKAGGQADFYAFKRDTRSTFSKNQAVEWKKNSGQDYETRSIPLFSLDSIAEKYFKEKSPDFISIDTEGYEEEILSGFSWNIRPKVFCIESAGRKEALASLFKSKNYAIYAETPANTIFVDILKRN